VKNRFQNLPFKCNLQRYAAAELCAPFPEAFARLTEYCDRLEEHYKDMMDIEFTVESGQLFILQCRPGWGSAR
jgi:pyruvate,orthophosphate dikinase